MAKTGGFAPKFPALLEGELRRAKAPGRKAASKPRGSSLGALRGKTGGRADKLPVKAPEGSFVIPADVVSALGEGNSAAGMEQLSSKFPGSSSSAAKMADGGVPIKVSDGEFIVSPKDVTALGSGDMQYGHEILDAFVQHARAENIQHLQSLPSPKR